MTCYVVMQGEYSDAYVKAIFSTQEKADEYIKANTKIDDIWDDIPYCIGSFEIDKYEIEKSENPTLYVSGFRCNADGMKREVKLDKQFNHPTTAYKERTFEYKEMIRNNYVFGEGFIVLENNYDEDKLIKIIADKIYEQLYAELEVKSSEDEKVD